MQISRSFVDLFLQYAWPGTSALWNYSTSRAVPEALFLWRFSPSAETYDFLPPGYQPTGLQLSAPHASVIDWVPFAPLRDRLILYHNNSITLDHFFVDFIQSFVVEIDDVSKVLVGAKNERGYFGVWNVFSAISGWPYPGTESRIGEVDQSVDLDSH
jgi:hypothetical protein